MSSKPQLSPQRWRQSISQREDSVHEDIVITSSTPAPLVTPEPKEIDSNVSEQLQAALCELAEVRLSLRLSRSDCASLRKTNKRLEADLEITQNQVQFSREAKSSIETNLIDCTRVDVNHQSLILKKLHEKIDCLENEVKRLQSVVESERRTYEAELEDCTAAIKAAGRERDEAQAKIKRLLEVSDTEVSADEVLWTNLMKKYQCGSKRSALLAWAQAHLADYPNIFVRNFSSDWDDGRAFCALIHHFRPNMVDRHELMEQKSCRVLAVRLAEKVKMRVDPATFLTPAQGYTDVKAIVFKLYKKLDTDEEHTHCSLDPLPRCACKIMIK